MEHVYRWDLDKTYLETDFDSVRGLVKTALEPAARKRALPGATALLNAIAQDNPGARIVILSGSPTQMRPVLEEKLRLDGVRFDELRLKDNLGNLRRGRLRAVRHQMGYKLPALLQGRVGLKAVVHETLFGDDAEQDALVYALYADLVSGQMDEAECAETLRAAGAYRDEVDAAIAALRRIEPSNAIDRVYIHLSRPRAPSLFAPLSEHVIPVHSHFQAAVLEFERERLSVSGLVAVAEGVLARGRHPVHLANLLQDLARRGWLNRALEERLMAVDGLVDVTGAFRGRWADAVTDTRRTQQRRAVDYLGLLPRFERRNARHA